MGGQIHPVVEDAEDFNAPSNPSRLVGNDRGGDGAEVVTQGVRVSEFLEISPLECGDSDIDRVPEGTNLGGLSIQVVECIQF